MALLRTVTNFVASLHISLIPKRLMHKEHKVPINNMNINIVEIGEGEKTLLLMPGTLGTAWSNFKPQLIGLPKFLPNFKIIAWDPPGYGKSIPPERSFRLNMFENDAYLAIELMEKLKRKKFSVLAWSAGGVTALIMAGRFPEVIEKLIITAAGPYVTTEILKNFQATRDIVHWPISMRNELEQIYDKNRLVIMWSSWVDLMQKFFIERNGDICKADVKCIQAPTFLIRGRKDSTVPAEHVAYLMKHIKCIKYHEFAEGAHSVHLTHADEFNTLVTEFLLEK